MSVTKCRYDTADDSNKQTHMGRSGGKGSHTFFDPDHPEAIALAEQMGTNATRICIHNDDDGLADAVGVGVVAFQIVVPGPVEPESEEEGTKSRVRSARGR